MKRYLIIALLLMLLTGCSSSKKSSKTYDTIEETAFHQVVEKSENANAEIRRTKDWVYIEYEDQSEPWDIEGIVIQGLADFVNIGKIIFEDDNTDQIQVFMKCKMNDGSYNSATSFTITKEQFNSIDWKEWELDNGIIPFLEHKIERVYINNDILKRIDINKVFYKGDR